MEINYNGIIYKTINEINELGEEIAVIESQIEAAKLDLAIDGIYADRNWFRKANYALKAKRALKKTKERELAFTHTLKKEADKNNRQESHQKNLSTNKVTKVEKEKIRQERFASIERNFVDVAKEMLPADDFSLIMKMAITRQELNERDGEES